MIFKRMPIAIAFTVLILTLIPAFALAAGGTISGKVAFPANTTLPANPNETVGVKTLTIYAMNTDTRFVNTTQPNPDGTYSIPVPADGLYRIFVVPSEVIDATDPASLKLAQYPDQEAREYFVRVSGNVANVNINYFAPGKYQPPNNITFATPTPKPTAVTPTPAPGFAALLVLAAFGSAAVYIGRKR